MHTGDRPFKCDQPGPSVRCPGRGFDAPSHWLQHATAPSRVQTPSTNISGSCTHSTSLCPAAAATANANQSRTCSLQPVPLTPRTPYQHPHRARATARAARRPTNACLPLMRAPWTRRDAIRAGIDHRHSRLLALRHPVLPTFRRLKSADLHGRMTSRHRIRACRCRLQVCIMRQSIRCRLFSQHNRIPVHLTRTLPFRQPSRQPNPTTSDAIKPHILLRRPSIITLTVNTKCSLSSSSTSVARKTRRYTRRSASWIRFSALHLGALILTAHARPAHRQNSLQKQRRPLLVRAWPRIARISCRILHPAYRIPPTVNSAFCCVKFYCTYAFRLCAFYLAL